MSAGLQVIGNNGNVQIDENFVNFCFIQSGSATTSAPTGHADDGWAAVTVPGETPIMAIDTGGESITLMRVVKSGSQFTYYFRCFGDSGPSGKTFIWYLFDKMPNTPSNGGLTVYDASGRVTFNSDKYPMRIVSMTRVPDGLPPTTPANDVFAMGTRAGQKLAVCLTNPKSRVIKSPYVVDNSEGCQYTQNMGTYNTIWNDNTPYVASGNYGPCRPFLPGSMIGAAQPYGGYVLAIDVSPFHVKFNPAFPDATAEP